MKWLLWEQAPRSRFERRDKLLRHPLTYNLSIPYFDYQSETTSLSHIRDAGIGSDLVVDGNDNYDLLRRLIFAFEVPAPHLALVTFVVETWRGRVAHLLPPMDVMFDIRNLSHEENITGAVCPVCASRQIDCYCKDPDSHLLVVPGLLEAKNLLIQGAGPSTVPTRGVELTPELAVQLDEWMQEFG